ncbi:hypothetical protein B1J93_08345 [Leptospira kirschneri serovar Pomona]|uniref:Uncharacterized protein n=1 Tax=Leptospira kirschneri serovar Pomona TaxID=561005 RepID=A0A1T1DQZ9_9LEPT|nr:hypothetical protein B1J93_08345 [Leptospira kirschneri serovar Pomona]
MNLKMWELIQNYILQQNSQDFRMRKTKFFYAKHRLINALYGSRLKLKTIIVLRFFYAIFDQSWRFARGRAGFTQIIYLELTLISKFSHRMSSL